jgi:hypothetical protein
MICVWDLPPSVPLRCPFELGGTLKPAQTPAGHPRPAMRRVSSAFTVLAMLFECCADALLARVVSTVACMACMVARKNWVWKFKCMHVRYHAKVHMMLLPFLATTVCAALGPEDAEWRAVGVLPLSLVPWPCSRSMAFNGDSLVLP